jgi:hypothetical protein
MKEPELHTFRAVFLYLWQKRVLEVGAGMSLSVVLASPSLSLSLSSFSLWHEEPRVAQSRMRCEPAHTLKKRALTTGDTER